MSPPAAPAAHVHDGPEAHRFARRQDLRQQVLPSGPTPQGGHASGSAKPVPRGALGWARRARGAALLLALPLTGLAQANNPRFTAEQIDQGREQFHRTCAQCHGRNMVNAGTTVYDLRKFPVDQSDRFFASVTNGKGNMPSFKEALAPEQVQLLWAYVGTRGGKEP